MEKVIYTHALANGTFCVFSERPQFLFNEVKQVHGIHCSYPSKSIVEADAIIQKQSDKTPILIKTADCLPIILEGEDENIFLHAGWRGLALGILEIEELKKIKPKNCFIGPAIHACCFEVGKDFNDLFSHIPLIHKKDKYFVDLIAFTVNELKKLFPEMNIQDSGICTMCDEHFHSYRRNKTTHRNFNVYFSKDDEWNQKNH